MVLDCIDLLEGGVRYRLILKFLISMTPKNIVNIVYVGFIHLFLPQFLTDGLVNILLFEVGHLCVSIGMLDDRVRDYGWHIRVGVGCQCLINYGWMADIALDRAKIPLQFLHHPGKLV